MINNIEQEDSFTQAPAAYVQCVKDKIAGGVKKDTAQKQCAIWYYKKFGETVNEVHKREQKEKSKGVLEIEPSIFIGNIESISDTCIGNGEKLEKALSSKKVNKDNDLMYLKFRFVHEGSNGNRDSFLKEELEDRHSTAIFKPLNWQHNEQKIVGTFYDTEIVSAEDSGNGKLGMNVYAVLYKWLFPDYAEEVRKRHANGTLFISMETWFDSAECSICGKKFAKASMYCDHLKNRYAMGSKVERILHGITFGGGGIVDTPADPDASALALAAQNMSLKNRVRKREEISKFEIAMNEAVNMFYNIIYSAFTDEERKEAQKDLNSLFNEIKEILDSVNVKQITKGEAVVDKSEIVETTVFPKDVVDILLANAKADSKASFEAKLAEELAKITASTEDKIKTMTAEIETLKQDKTKLEADLSTANDTFTNYKNTIETEKLLASRIQVLNAKEINAKTVGMEEVEFNKVVTEMSDVAFDVFTKAIKQPETKPVGNTSAELQIVDNDVAKTEAPKDIDLVAEALSKL
jgi:ribosomal protein S7